MTATQPLKGDLIIAEQTLFSPEAARLLEQQARDLVGKEPTVTVEPRQIVVTADYVPPSGHKARDNAVMFLLATFTLLVGYLAWKTTILDGPAGLAYPYVVSVAAMFGTALSAFEATLYAYLAAGVGFVILLMLAVFFGLDHRHFLSGRTLHVAMTPEAIVVRRLFWRSQRYSRITRMTFEMRPHERAKDEDYLESRQLRQNRRSAVGRYYRKAFHVALRLGEYRRVDLADVYGEREAEAIHNALNFALDAIQHLPRPPQPPSKTKGTAPNAAYGERPPV